MSAAAETVPIDIVRAMVVQHLEALPLMPPTPLASAVVAHAGAVVVSPPKRSRPRKHPVVERAGATA